MASDALIFDIRTVLAAEIFDDTFHPDLAQDRMLATHRRIVQHDIVAGLATDLGVAQFERYVADQFTLLADYQLTHSRRSVLVFDPDSLTVTSQNAGRR